MMYLTTAEAKAQRLGTVDEQINNYNAAVARILETAHETQAERDAHREMIGRFYFKK